MSLFNTNLDFESDTSSELPDEPVSEPLITAENGLHANPDNVARSSSPALPAEQVDNLSQPFEDSDYNDLSDGELDRPNRWHGSDAKLRGYYSQARHTLAALDTIDDDDLSLHLYNVHGLKRGLYPDYAKADSPARYEQWMRKGRLLESGEWHPHKQWTAWPLEPGTVPRGDERMLWAKERLGETEARKADLSRRASTKPSQELEELLLAEVTKQARRTFEAREWATDPGGDVGNGNDHQVKSASLKRSASAPSRKVERSSKAPRTVRHDSVGPLAAKSQTSSKHESRDGELRPVVISDDDLARELAQPSINNIISHLNSLLLALHHSREHQLTSIRVRSNNNGKSRRTSEDNKRAPSQSSSEDDSGTSDSAKSSSRTRNRLQPRDWSEVLAMASATGWDQKVIRRAQERCQALFEEQMSFHNDLDTGPYDLLRFGASPLNGKYADRDTMSGGVHLDGFMQPLKRYPSKRTQKSQSRDMSGSHRSPTKSTGPRSSAKQVKCLDCGETDRKKFPIRVSADSLCNTCRAFLHRHGRHRQVESSEQGGSSQQHFAKSSQNNSCNHCGRKLNRNKNEKLKRGPDGPKTLCKACHMEWYRTGTLPARAAAVDEAADVGEAAGEGARNEESQ